MRCWSSGDSPTAGPGAGGDGSRWTWSAGRGRAVRVIGRWPPAAACGRSYTRRVGLRHSRRRVAQLFGRTGVPASGHGRPAAQSRIDLGGIQHHAYSYAPRRRGGRSRAVRAGGPAGVRRGRAGRPSRPADVAAPVPGSRDDGLTNETVRPTRRPPRADLHRSRARAHLRRSATRRDYFLAPGGDFEGTTAGWQLTAARASPAATSRSTSSAAAPSSLPCPRAVRPPRPCSASTSTTRRSASSPSAQAAADAGLQVDVIYPEIAKGNVHQAASYKPYRRGR